ncbi:MAG: hypothetical protein R3242_04795 [Akkermansiaceae bacterium]|nr:hypothetical protein [Akkermansiaceae bacterium]
MKSPFFIFCALLTLCSAGTASARDLDVAAAQKQEIRHGQIGPRDTLIFYTFADQDAVLQLDIKHEGGKFTLTGKVQLFKEGTGAEEIGKWINNQHSCGLFPDVPKPEATVALPADALSVVESKLKEGAEMPESPVTGDKFQDYALKIEVSELKMDGFRLKSFAADTGAFVKVGPAG